MLYVQVHTLLFRVATSRADVAAHVAGTVAATIHQHTGHVPAAAYGVPPVQYHQVQQLPDGETALDLVELVATIQQRGPRTEAQRRVLPTAAAGCQRAAAL